MLRRRHLGRVSFAEANDLQRALMQAGDDYVLLFEHPPTYTRGHPHPGGALPGRPDSLDAVVVDVPWPGLSGSKTSKGNQQGKTAQGANE